MKKYITLAALLSAGAAFANAETTEAFEFTSAGQTIPLVNEYDLTKDWTLTFSLLLNPMTGATDWGTSLISADGSSGDYEKLQVYAWGGAKNPADTIVVKANASSDEKGKFTITGQDSLTAWQYYYSIGSPFTFTLTHDASEAYLRVNVGLGAGYDPVVNDVIENVSFAGLTLSSFKTGIADAQLAKVGEGAWAAAQWSLPKGSFTGTAIPEPSAFGLLAGLGALALVGTRRRRK